MLPFDTYIQDPLYTFILITVVNIVVKSKHRPFINASRFMFIEPINGMTSLASQGGNSLGSPLRDI